MGCVAAPRPAGCACRLPPRGWTAALPSSARTGAHSSECTRKSCCDHQSVRSRPAACSCPAASTCPEGAEEQQSGSKMLRVSINSAHARYTLAVSARSVPMRGRTSSALYCTIERAASAENSHNQHGHRAHVQCNGQHTSTATSLRIRVVQLGITLPSPDLPAAALLSLCPSDFGRPPAERNPFPRFQTY